ncbi:pilus assembly protein TadG-related protein [Micromonospora globispora]|uniref:pilus assembly protein TadG-related protein n=1 Tax=Micromonospora globispora TaxID=1450148 RepID=UPI000F510BBE|nr:Tad domain-containing protein [Micromonospora globispora]
MSVIRRLRARMAGAPGDRGAVATTVALLLGSGVLLGMAALVVDVGNLYAERGQLQNGADGGAIKVAQICATNPADCSPEVTDFDDVVDRYAERNANDGAAAATVCGRGGDLPACPPWQDRLTNCVGPPPEDKSYVEVHTSTRTTDGSTVLPPVFAQAVVGGFEGAQVAACSRVAWGPPARATTLALTISACEWNRYTEARAFPAVERSFPVYDEKTSTTCAPVTGSGGGPGGYRFLEDADDDCRTTSAVGAARRVYTGDSWPTSCKGDSLRDLVTAGRPVLVPVFGAISGGGGNAQYSVSGYAAFVVTGWHLPGLDVPSPERSSCDDGAKSCVFGYFTQTLVPGGGAIGGPDLGARVVAPIG